MESKPLSYDSLKVVLKHLDFNSRFQLFQQSPSLHKTLKLSPGYIKHLQFDVNCVTINNRTIYEYRTTPINGRKNCYKIFLSILNFSIKRNTSEFYEETTFQRNHCNPMEYFLKTILGGKGVLKVGTLIFKDAARLKIPDTLKFHVHHVNVSKGDSDKILQKFAGIFQNSSFKSIELGATKNFDYPMIKSAEKLILNTKRGLKELEYQEIHVKFQIDAECLLDLVEYWLGAESGKEAGAQYTFEMKNEKEARKLIDVVKQKYEMEYYVKPRWSTYKPSFEFPMRNFSSLIIDYYPMKNGFLILDMRIVQFC